MSAPLPAGARPSPMRPEALPIVGASAHTECEPAQTEEERGRRP